MKIFTFSFSDWGSFETDASSKGAHAQLFSGTYSSRRSRKTEFEFPDGDLILTSNEAGENEDMENLPMIRSGPCSCWNTTSDFLGMEVECKCSASNFTQLHGTTQLPADIHRL